MLTVIVVLALLWIAWFLFVRWQMARPRGVVVYNRVVGAFLSYGTVISLWRTIYVNDPSQFPLVVEDGPARTHELFHIDQQWARWPLTFVFRYLWEARRGYACNAFEEAARIAAGQPMRCGKAAVV